MMNKKQIHNLIILDESGSMESIKQATISGFNELVQTIKGSTELYPDQEHFISLITFNGLGINTKLFRQPVADLEQIDERIYRPNSLTPLLDAIGQSVIKLKYALDQTKEHHVLVTILTDGEENASKEFSGEQVRRIVEEQKQKGWTFTYIGANHDVVKTASAISITNTLVFESSEQGTKAMFKKEKSSRLSWLYKLDNNEDAQQDYYNEGSK
ncbi:vWA domain-containing protein [Rufibacter aurantiacus]|uniref:vWA domain-containing protein n=1 Tax=Rufibacter aurantiacus TaxID=2817374 RepID=UPI001B30F553|nr:VWA domain-containing protein [Rufibacter aurantiacus]